MSRRTAALVAALFAVLSLPAGAAAAPAPLTEPSGALEQALECGPGVEGAQKTPVILVHGTGSTPEESFSFGYEKALPGLGYPVCTVRLPERAGADLQRSIQYVVFAIRTVAARSGRKVSLVGHSQGGMLAVYAPHFWEDLPPLIDDVIGLAGPYYGTQRANDNCSDGVCPVTSWQFRRGSELTKAFAARARPAGPSFTAIATAFDELVTPAPDAAKLEGEGVTNVVVQDLCPGRPVEHFAIVGDAAAYALAVDALANPGGAGTDPKRFSPTTCAQGTIPGGDPVGTAVTGPQAIAFAARELATGPQVDREPALVCPFDQAACSGGSSGGPGPPSGDGAPGPSTNEQTRGMRLTRICRRPGVLRVRLSDPRRRVRSVAFTFGRRVIARDTRAPFARTVARRPLQRTRATKLRAVIRLRGASRPVVLVRTLPRCGLRR